MSNETKAKVWKSINFVMLFIALVGGVSSFAIVVVKENYQKSNKNESIIAMLQTSDEKREGENTAMLILMAEIRSKLAVHNTELLYLKEDIVELKNGN